MLLNVLQYGRDLIQTGVGVALGGRALHKVRKAGLQKVQHHQHPLHVVAKLVAARGGKLFIIVLQLPGLLLVEGGHAAAGGDAGGEVGLPGAELLQHIRRNVERDAAVLLVGHAAVEHRAVDEEELPPEQGKHLRSNKENALACDAEHDLNVLVEMGLIRRVGVIFTDMSFVLALQHKKGTSHHNLKTA